MNTELLINRIRELCDKKGVSMNSAFIQSGVGKNFKVNLKYSNPSMGKITMLANYFGVSTDYLLGKTDDPSRSDKPAVTDDDLKVALFGGDKNVTDEMWREVLNFAEFIKNKKKNEHNMMH